MFYTQVFLLCVGAFFHYFFYFFISSADLFRQVVWLQEFSLVQQQGFYHFHSSYISHWEVFWVYCVLAKPEHILQFHKEYITKDKCASVYLSVRWVRTTRNAKFASTVYGFMNLSNISPNLTSCLHNTWWGWACFLPRSTKVVETWAIQRVLRAVMWSWGVPAWPVWKSCPR